MFSANVYRNPESERRQADRRKMMNNDKLEIAWESPLRVHVTDTRTGRLAG